MYDSLISPQCGFSATGVNITGRSEGSMNQTQHDELAALFAQRMNFATGEQMQQDQPRTFVEPVPVPQFSDEKQSQPTIHYASAHYTHSHHLHDNTSEPSRSPPPAYHETVLPSHLAETLRQNSIDPSALLPNQLHLYNNADLDQRLRLLELWRISPPSYSQEEHLHIYTTQTPTSLAQEEASARQRYEEAQTAAAQQNYEPKALVFDTHIEPAPPRITPIRRANSPAFPPAARMRAASIASSKPSAHATAEAEPYIMDGYQASASSTEPVYAATSNGLWPGAQQGMEDQYGSFMQIRNHADWEAMNERVARERFGMVVHSAGNGRGDDDDDMVM
ncbi:hypothetical protein Q7P37_003001 [Cladosporium fusiforme]